MTNYIVIGNGTSRQGINISILSDISETFGCNHIYQDYKVKNLIAADRSIAQEIVSSGMHNLTNFYTREKWYNLFGLPHNVNPFPVLVKEGMNKWEHADNWGSGLYACYIACLGQPDKISLLGFDLDGFNSVSKNDIYKEKLLQIPGSSTFRADKPVDASFWIKQFLLLFSWFPNIEFEFVNNHTWKQPDSFLTYNNYRFLTYDKFNKDFDLD